MLHLIVFDHLRWLVRYFDPSKTDVVFQQTKALKGLATCAQLSVHPDDISEKSDTASLSGNFVSEFHIPGGEIPLDLSMKTYVRLVSSSPLNW